MPRIFSEDMFDEATLRRLDEAEDGDFNPYAVPPAAFVYLSPPDWGGPKAVSKDEGGLTNARGPPLLPRLPIADRLFPRNRQLSKTRTHAIKDAHRRGRANDPARISHYHDIPLRHGPSRGLARRAR